jgi:hypothetical protein
LAAKVLILLMMKPDLKRPSDLMPLPMHKLP